jgi:hypothetical protein
MSNTRDRKVISKSPEEVSKLLDEINIELKTDFTNDENAAVKKYGQMFKPKKLVHYPKIDKHQMNQDTSKKKPQ